MFRKVKFFSSKKKKEKKKVEEKKAKKTPVVEPKKVSLTSKKILTAEGWKRSQTTK